MSKKKNSNSYMESAVPPVGDDSLPAVPSDSDGYSAVVQSSAPDVSAPVFRTVGDQGRVLDVRREGHQLREGVWRLERFVEGAEYRDYLNGRWIWSIGQNIFDGRIEASVDTRYYGDSNWNCLFLR